MSLGRSEIGLFFLRIEEHSRYTMMFSHGMHRSALR